MTETPDKRKLSELRVVDLKHELEKRGKDGSGVKNVLLEKLTQALRDEGLNPEMVEFEVVVSKTPAKKGKSSAGSKTDEESGTADATTLEGAGGGGEEDTDNTKLEENTSVAEDDGVVEATEDAPEEKVEGKQQDPIAEEQEKNTEKPEEANDSKEGSDNENPSKEEVKDDQGDAKGQDKDTPFAKPAEPVTVDKSAPEDNSTKSIDLKDDPKEADNEDSLNLTIGEEDEKLLHDSNMEVDQKDEVEPSSSNQCGEKASDSTSEEPKKPDEKREGKSEKSVTTSSTEKELRKLRGR